MKQLVMGTQVIEYSNYAGETTVHPVYFIPGVQDESTAKEIFSLYYQNAFDGEKPYFGGINHDYFFKVVTIEVDSIYEGFAYMLLDGTFVSNNVPKFLNKQSEVFLKDRLEQCNSSIGYF